MRPSDRFRVRQGWLFDPIAEFMLPVLCKDDYGREPVEAFAFHAGTFLLLYVDILEVDDLIEELA
jgi:hypothetical protein